MTVTANMTDIRKTPKFTKSVEPPITEKTPFKPYSTPTNIFNTLC